MVGQDSQAPDSVRAEDVCQASRRELISCCLPPIITYYIILRYLEAPGHCQAQQENDQATGSSGNGGVHGHLRRHEACSQGGWWRAQIGHMPYILQLECELGIVADTELDFIACWTVTRYTCSMLMERPESGPIYFLNLEACTRMTSDSVPSNPGAEADSICKGVAKVSRTSSVLNAVRCIFEQLLRL